MPYFAFIWCLETLLKEGSRVITYESLFLEVELFHYAALNGNTL